MDKLRIAYESNQVSGPYLPLSRFGNYYVTVYNPAGEVSEFMLREKESEAKQLAVGSNYDLVVD